MGQPWSPLPAERHHRLFPQSSCAGLAKTWAVWLAQAGLWVRRAVASMPIVQPALARPVPHGLLLGSGGM